MLMRIILFISVLIFATTLQGVAQSKLVPVSRSPLTGIELPANTQQDNRILSTASARTLLKMKAEENALTTGEQVEVFSMPPSTGNQTIDKVKIAAQQAGWEVRPFTNEVTYSLLVNNQRTVLMYIESLKKETALYFLIVTSPAPAPSTKNSSTTEVMAQPKPTETPVKTETLNQTQTPVVVPAVATKQQEDKTSVSTTSTSSAAATDNAYFTYSTINFDDGWTSTIEEDWVKVALFSYPNYR